MTIARVSIQPLESYDPDAVRTALHDLLAPIGGIQAFVRPGQNVVLKPNLLKPGSVEEAVSTHPEIIAQLADLAATQRPQQILITDSPGIGTATRIAKKLGLRESSNWKVVNSDEAILMSLPEDGQGHPGLRISKIISEADAVINIAKAKTHGQMIITAAAKNTFGAVVGLEKAQWHYRIGKNPDNFARLIVHIHQAVAPALNILDAVIGMEGNGPGSGTPRKLGFLMASTNAHALDYVLSRIWEIPADGVYTLRAAKQLGLLPVPGDIEIIGPDIDTLRPNPRWKLAHPMNLQRLVGPAFMAPIMERLIGVKPLVHHEKCTLCMECAHHCAAEAMDADTGMIRIDEKKCISCFCCQEMCPQGAITIKSGPLANLLGLRK